MKTIQLFFAVFLLTAWCSLTTLQAQTNLVSNPGFETVNEDGTPADWTNLSTTLAIEVVSDTIYAGSNSLRVSTTDFAGEYMVAYIPVTAGKTYNLSAWCNLQSYTGTSSSRTRMGMAYTYVDENGNTLDAAGYILSGDITSTNLGFTSIAAMTSATNTWQQLSLTTSEVTPSNAAYIVLALTSARVTAYFDNVSVTEVGAVSKQDQTISGLSDMSKTVGDADFSLSATATSGLAVTYSSSNTAVATISGSTVHIVGAGTTTITASQAGDDTYNAATDVTATLTVSKATQTITGLSNMDKTVGDADFTLSATASSSLTVTYSSSNENVATISGSTVHIVGAGTTTITASQAGNDTYNAATDVTATLTVNDPTGISQVSTQLPLRIQNGNIIVTTQSGNTVEVYNALGLKLQSQTANSTETTLSNLPQGQVLIVRSGNAVAKVIL